MNKTVEKTVLTVQEFKKVDRQLPKLKKELKKQAQQFLKDNYNLDLEIPIKYKYTGSTRYGSFRSYKDDNQTPVDIIIDTKVLYYGLISKDVDFCFNVLMHELIHYALNVFKKPFSDGDEYFETEIKKYGVLSSGTTKETNLNAGNKMQKDIRLLDTYVESDYLTGKEIDKSDNYTHTQKDYSSDGVLRADGKVYKFKRTAITLKVENG